MEAHKNNSCINRLETKAVDEQVFNGINQSCPSRYYTVAQDGSGDFSTIQAAINAMPDNAINELEIRIKQGVYYEKLHMDKPKIHLIGEGAEQTVVTYDDYALKKFPDGQLYHTFHSYTAFIGEDDFTAEGLSFVNSAGPGKEVGQALAIYVDGDRAAFRNCRFIGHQDTIFTGPLPPKPMDRSFFGGPRDGAERRKLRQYFEDCYIEGDVDFIFGSATAVFKGCEIFSQNRISDTAPAENTVNGWITAASTPEDVRHGYVFIDCTLTSNAPPQSIYLGRPWRNHAKVCFLNCWMGAHVKMEGWHNWNKPDAETTVVYAEFNSKGPGAASAEERVSWAKRLTEEEASEYTAAHILSGVDGWLPFR
ncbi:pectinesterase family protein [Paenibacillus sp. 7523-1]|uniref:pectinesterase family protein n=1 Tax=Paenibacillus sp. 7523-1 TaxID=2022550 RepID=UPI000BA5FC6E|nr:pectinesterase family protein [Paenibacillus sp. 7523-1]PAD32909.1 pectin methylesterase [Paenibacillus sp. 7523-1]